jgi:hypothetical protein
LPPAPVVVQRQGLGQRPGLGKVPHTALVP